MTVRSNGVEAVVASTVSCSPAGAESNVRSTVCGSSVTDVVPGRFWLSSAVSWISSVAGYSVSGARKDPG